MQLSPAERDRLLLFTAAELARARRSRGLLLNVPEATALVADTVAESARDGRRLHEAIAAGRAALRRDEVLPGVPEIVGRVEVEAVFDDGTRLAVVPDPFAAPTEPAPARPGSAAADPAPGTVLVSPGAGPAGRVATTTVPVHNTTTVPVSVSSHLHFFEANAGLRFDRARAYGMRLAVPAGEVERFDPGDTREVGLVPLGGARVAVGFAGLVDGPLDAPGAREQALARARACGYLDTGGGTGEDGG